MQNELTAFLGNDLNLKDLLEIINPQNNLVLADDVMLVDADGVIRMVSENYERDFGFSHNSIVGKTVYELEKNGTFSPSISVQVIREKRCITRTQTINQVHTNVMTVAVPLFDDFKRLKYVACFNTVSMAQINSIHRNYQKMQNSLLRYSQELADMRARSYAPQLVIKSDAMRKIWDLICNINNTNATILISGETGVGKTTIAETIHAISDRYNGAYVEANCGSLNDSVIEAEFFGYSRALKNSRLSKVELANHGTLVLDEICELSPHVQSRLLNLVRTHSMLRTRTKEEIKLDFQLITTSTQDPAEAVRAGTLRSDLYFRLNVIHIHIPPLRERREDILPLAQIFLTDACQKYGKNLSFSPRFLAFLERYSWPGNARQLSNMIERIVITTQDTMIDLDSLPSEYAEQSAIQASLLNRASLSEQMDAYEGQIIREAYCQLGTSMAVAKALGISQPTAARKIAKYVKEQP